MNAHRETGACSSGGSSRLLAIVPIILMLGAGLTPAAGFVPTGDMTTTRSAASAAMAGGKVLLAGGTPFAGFCASLSSAEIYDPATGLFSAAADLNATRCTARAVTLLDGDVLVVGGLGEGLMSAETYDPGADVFTPTGPLNDARGDGFTLTLLADGRVLVAGGATAAGITDAAEIFDPVSRTFTSTGAMTAPRAYHVAAPLPGGRVLIVGGGSDTDCLPTAQSAEIFDPAMGSFAPAAIPAEPVWAAVSIVLSDGKVLIAGGEPSCGATLDGTVAAQLYDPAGDQFHSLPDMPAAHGFGAGASPLPGGRVLITGGLTGAGPVDTAVLFEPSSGAFGPPMAMSSPRARHAQVTLPDGRALIAGGESGPFDTTDTAELFEAPSALMAWVDVIPQMQRLSSRGRYVSVFVGLPGRDASQIEPGSLRLAVDGSGSLAPDRAPRIIQDRDGDGFSDLMIKFSRAEFLSLAGPGAGLVTVRGSLVDSTPFEGSAQVEFK